MQPDHSRTRTRGRTHPVQRERNSQPPAMNPGAVAHPAAVPYPPQGGATLFWR